MEKLISFIMIIDIITGALNSRVKFLDI